MESSLNLKKFVDEVFSINPAQTNTLVPGAGNNSFTASAMDILNELRRSTAEFAKKKSNNSTQDEVAVLAQKIEGYLLNLQAINEISKDLADRLISQLYSI